MHVCSICFESRSRAGGSESNKKPTIAKSMRAKDSTKIGCNAKSIQSQGTPE